MTGLIASIVEAYGELRVNKGRILLSLVGVAFSVFALTAVMGGGGMLTSALTQSTETWAGRDTTLTIYPAVRGGSDEDDVLFVRRERRAVSARGLALLVPSGMRVPFRLVSEVPVGGLEVVDDLHCEILLLFCDLNLILRRTGWSD